MGEPMRSNFEPDGTRVALLEWPAAVGQTPVAEQVDGVGEPSIVEGVSADWK
jgi:hypothetical protein